MHNVPIVIAIQPPVRTSRMWRPAFAILQAYASVMTHNPHAINGTKVGTMITLILRMT